MSRALRYVRDRVCVPRDMSLQAARALRGALEEVASVADGEGKEKQQRGACVGLDELG